MITHVGYVRSLSADPLHGEVCTVNLEGTDLILPADGEKQPILVDHFGGRVTIGDRVTVTRVGDTWIAQRCSD